MTYALIAIFVLSGNAYMERGGLSFEACAGRAAMARADLNGDAQLMAEIGKVRFICVPEGHALGKVEVK